MRNRRSVEEQLVHALTRDKNWDTSKTLWPLVWHELYIRHCHIAGHRLLTGTAVALLLFEVTRQLILWLCFKPQGYVGPAIIVIGFTATHFIVWGGCAIAFILGIRLMLKH